MPVFAHILGVDEVIDVVIPVRDVDQWLDEAISSVLTQEGVDVSVTVVDAGSKRPITLSGAIDDDPRVLLVRSEEPLVAGAARNLGVSRGSAELLGFLDADDLWPPQRCRELVEAFASAQVDLVIGRVEEFGSREGLVPGPAHLAGGVLIRRATYEAIGGQNSTLATGEWVDFMARARHEGLQELETNVLALRRRIHGASTTVARRDLRKEYLKVVRAQLARRENPDG